MLQNDIRNKLRSVYDLDDDWAAVLISGSGTAATESMLSSLTGRSDKILILENGVYGERMTRIAEIHGLAHIIQHHPWGQAIDITMLRQNLEQGVSLLAVVQHETTTGRLNNIADIAEVCSEYEVPILLDGVSSFGAEGISFKDWNVVACAASANKCLHGVPGMAFVVLNRKYLKGLETHANTLYLDLQNYIAQQDKGGTPFTQAVQSMYALNEALNEHSDQGGWTGRQKSYRHRLKIVDDGLIALGIEPYIPLQDASCVLHSYHLPDGHDYQSFHDKLKDAGFIIYAGQGTLSEQVFRISMMGDLDETVAHRFIETVKTIVKV
jgi:2-aminoethylphosphonate-pyruvate transaminase